MKRREFIEKAGYGAAGIAASPIAKPGANDTKSVVLRRYDMEVEVYEVGKKTRCHKLGEKFKYPQDMGKICGFLASAMDPILTSLNSGAIYTWKYAGTPYEKVIDPEGVTTEYIRCPDPSEAGIVVKITRTFKSKRTVEL
jgi:uncharacterized repeat protein (TIGR04076 family)